MPLVKIRPYKDDGTPTTLVDKILWLPVLNVNKAISESIIKVEEYLNTIFDPSCIKSIFLCTDCARIVKDLVSFHVKVVIKESARKKVVFTLKSIKINISPLAFYKPVKTDVIDIIDLTVNSYCATARYNAVMGLSDYSGSSYAGDILKIHDLLNSGKSLIFGYEMKEQFCRFYEPLKDEFDGCITDELGRVFVNFNDIGKLKPITETVIGCKYHLVGTRYYAEGTRKDYVHCILFAETDNKHDEHAVKILRWFPRIKNKSTISECFFDIGYISHEENESLHKFMVEKHNKVLFGHIENGMVTIDAGIKSLKKTDCSFPINLINNV